MINLRDNKKIRLYYRRFITLLHKFLFGLKGVHIDFYFSGRSHVSRDFVTGYYGFMARGCTICPRVVVRNYVMFGPNVTITGSDHKFDKVGVPMIFSGRPSLPSTLIDSDVWIGNGVLIMAGVNIGRGSIIGARSVVTKDIPPYEIHAGIPAKFIASRFSSESHKLMHDSMLNDCKFDGIFCNKIGEINDV